MNAREADRGATAERRFEWTRDQKDFLSRRVQAAADLLRGASANFISTFIATTLSVIGAMLTLSSTEDGKINSSDVAALIILGGAFVSTLLMMIVLSVEVVRAQRLTFQWNNLLERAFNGTIGPEEVWPQIQRGRISVSVNLKINLPVGIFLTSVIAGLGTLLFDMKF